MLRNPRSGLLQGAEDHLRHTAQRKGGSEQTSERLRAVLADWDTCPLQR